MANSNEADRDGVKSDRRNNLKQKLMKLQAIETNERTTAEVMAEMMPLVKGCRKRGHSWKRIALLFQEEVPGITVAKLRKYAFEADPSLKDSSKSTKESIVAESALPGLDNDDIEGIEEVKEIGELEGAEEIDEVEDELNTAADEDELDINEIDEDEDELGADEIDEDESDSDLEEDEDADESIDLFTSSKALK